MRIKARSDTHMPRLNHEQVTPCSQQSTQCFMAKSKFVVNWCELFGNCMDAFSFLFSFFATHCHDEFVPVWGKNAGKWKRAFTLKLYRTLELSPLLSFWRSLLVFIFKISGWQYYIILATLELIVPSWRSLASFLRSCLCAEKS